MVESVRTEPRVRLAAVASAPVFYQIPLYRELAADPRIDLTVFFASSGGVRPYNASFGDRAITWDVDLLSGYRHRFLKAADSNEVRGGFFALRDWDIVKEIRQGQFDVVWVHGFSYFTLVLAIVTALTKRMPVLLREEQTLLHERRWPKRWIRAVVLHALFRRVHALSIGSNNAAYFRRYGVSEERLFFAPYCVDNDLLQADAKRLAGQREELRSSFGIPPDAGPITLFVGKLAAKKQPLMALEAHARVRARMRCALLVVGDGELKAEMRRRVERGQIDDVYFAGFLNRSEISRAYGVADVLVLPSAFHETWGIVVSEAMNFSLPVVVSEKVGSAADLIRERENGFIVRHDDVSGFTSAIEAVLADRRQRSAFGARSLEIISRWRYETAREGIVAACAAGLGAAPANSKRSKLRVAFLPMLPPSNAATRVFCEGLLPHLADRGIAGRMYLPSSDRAYRRFLGRSGFFRLPFAAFYWYGIVLPRRLFQLPRALRSDVLFVQRNLLHRRARPTLERALSALARPFGRRIVYHCDDALWTVTRPNAYRTRFRLADLVLAGNADIANFARQVNPNVRSLAGGLEIERYPLRRHERREPVVIGWVGTSPENLAPVADALADLCRTFPARLTVVTGRVEAVPDLGSAVTIESWSRERRFDVFADLDIGIMPLDDTPYARAKEGFKLKEYMAAGLPIVCSPVGHNRELVRNGVNGFHAATPEEWTNRLARLVEDAELRSRMGAAGRKMVQPFDIAIQASRLADALETIVS